MSKALHKNLKEARKKKGWSQQQMANKLDIGIKRYAKYEEDRAEPSFDMVKQCMEVFGIKEEEMYPFVFNDNFWSK